MTEWMTEYIPRLTALEQLKEGKERAAHPEDGLEKAGL
jgi:hypothetical protein